MTPPELPPDDDALRAAHSTLRQPRPEADELRARLTEVARLLALAPAAPAEPSLVFVRPGSASAEVRAVGKQVVIGRGDDCDVRFEDRREFSRRHFAVRRERERYFVEDLGSSNGTRIKGRGPLVSRHDLRDGDLIAAGGLVFLFVRCG